MDFSRQDMIDNFNHHDMDECRYANDDRVMFELPALEHHIFFNVVCPYINQRHTDSRVHGISGCHGTNGYVVCWINRWSQNVLQNDDIKHQTMIARTCKREALILET